jgi:translocation and assembly module TamB
MRRVVLLSGVVLALGTGAVPAQDAGEAADRDFLTAFLEDNLSGAGRQVTITGFRGALASEVTIERLTIADDQGIWLAIDGVTLDWSRSALLSGVIDVSELSADRIEVVRPPVTQDDAVPSPEAGTFQLPDLPVSIGIDQLAADRIVLGEAVLGQPVEGRLSAALTLAAGAGTARLDLVRDDAGPDGEISLNAGFDNATGQLNIALSAVEGAGGLAATLLGIPGAPATSLTLGGSGPIGDFAASLALATDGETRLAGTVTLRDPGNGDLRLLADVAGNLAPILAPAQVDFFGNRIALAVDATRIAAGGIRVDRLDLAARSLQVAGEMSLTAEGVPESADLTVVLADPGGEALLLPFGGAETRIGSAALDLGLAGGAWQADLRVEDVDRAGLAIAALTLDGAGRLGPTPEGNAFSGDLAFAATGLRPADPGLAQALGTDLTGSVRLDHVDGSGALSLTDLRLEGAGLAAAADLRVAGLDAALLTTGTVTVEAEDLSRFSALVGRPLSGAGRLVWDGSVSGLTGFVDGTLALDGQAVAVGIDALDRLMAGPVTARASVLRDATGTLLRSLDLAAGPLRAQASGKLASAGSELAGDVALADLSVLGPGLGGALNLRAGFAGTPEAARITVEGTAQTLRTGQARLDPLLRGTSRLSAALTLSEGRAGLTQLDLANPQVTLTVATADARSGAPLRVAGRIANLGLVLPSLPGALAVTGTISETAQSYALDLAARGPGGLDARVNGGIARDFASADLRIAGSGQAVLANLVLEPRSLTGLLRYDLALRGPLRLASLAGRMTLADGRLTDPGLPFALQGIEAMADLSGGQARVAATSGLTTGGRLRVDGTLGLEAPFAARLAVALDAVRLVDPALYDTTLSGNLAVTGPMLGGALIAGALALGETELLVPSSGFDTAATLLAIRHRNEPAEVRATRDRAGLLDSGRSAAGASSARPFGLDILISAPGRIFLRGRGIDAELGGQLRLAGTTEAIVPSGAFNLIRGRLDILGKRLTLSQADLTLGGSFVPVLAVAATTESDGVQSSVTITGPADDPEVAFTSVPDLPQEEVLARLLFGRDLGSISALQAAQLANAVAVLAGRGGTGIVARLRQSFGFDDLDLATAEDGTTALTIGKYLTDNLYADVEIEQGGQTSINLNLDIREGVTARARLADDGETGLGIFLERDY